MATLAPLPRAQASFVWPCPRLGREGMRASWELRGGRILGRRPSCARLLTCAQVLPWQLRFGCSWLFRHWVSNAVGGNLRPPTAVRSFVFPYFGQMNKVSAAQDPKYRSGGRLVPGLDWPRG